MKQIKQKIMILNSESNAILHVADTFPVSNILARSLLDVKQIFLAPGSPLAAEVDALTNLDAQPKKIKNAAIDTILDLPQNDQTPRFREQRRLIKLRYPLAGYLYKVSCSITCTHDILPKDSSGLLMYAVQNSNSLALEEYAAIRGLPIDEASAELQLYLEAELMVKIRTAALIHKYTDLLRTVFTIKDQQELRNQISREVTVFL